MKQTFFDEPLEQSKVKSQIVVKYFDAWANIIKSYTQKIGYVDLFAGQGYYEDGTESTPLLILKKAIENPSICQKLIAEFNDKNPEYVKTLREAVNQLEGLKNLACVPKISNVIVSTELAEKYKNAELPPTLFFLDPWGYKGLSLDLIQVSIKAWASECILFFNYDRINRDLTNPVVCKSVNEFLGESRAEKLRATIQGMEPYKREELIVQEVCEALKEMGGKYSLPFCFLNRKREKTSHYLIHITKNDRGYGIMKEIMAEYSQKDEDGVPSFIFDPKPTRQLFLTFNRPLRYLTEQLVSKFKGQSLRAGDVYKRHQETTRFTKRNYKDTLLMLEQNGKIKVDKPAEKRTQRCGNLTLGVDRIVTFI
jgi:three-Cys-motif partner protein